MSRSFLTPINLNKLELQNFRLQQLGTPPGSPVTGQLYYDTGTNRVFWWNGTAWIDPQARASHSGTQLASTVSDFDAQVRTSRLDQMAAPTAAVSLNSQKITGLADPTVASDAANKNYVDLARQGITQKDACLVATTANITLSGTQTIDGVAVVVGNRVLVKAQTTPAQNGIYVCAAGAWSRASDTDTAAELNDGATSWVQQGTTLANTSWTQIATITTLGTDPVTWVQQGASVAYLAGNGLNLVGSTFNVVAGSGITADGTSTRINPVVVARGFTAVLSTSATSYVVTHNLAWQWVLCQVVHNISPFDQVDADIELTDTNNVTIRFAVAPTANDYRVLGAAVGG
jgi:hypothetical protein